MPRRAYRLPKANIALEGNIANHARDLYRCVFSVKDNTLNECLFCCAEIKLSFCLFLVECAFFSCILFVLLEECFCCFGILFCK